MARIVICAENYGGPGTGSMAHRLATALSQRGHSVQGKVSLSLTPQEIKGLQADLVIGQHKAIGIAQTIANNTNVPFVLVINGEKYSASMKADLVVFPSQPYLVGYRAELGSTPAVSIENGFKDFCDIVTKLAEDSAANKLRIANIGAAERLAAENASRAAIELTATNARTEAAERALKIESAKLGSAGKFIARSEVRQQVAPASFIKPTVPLYPTPQVRTVAARMPAAKPKADPTVSIIVVAQDDETRIEQTLRSLLSQAYQEIEVIVVDDGSTDGTGRAIAEIKDPRVMVFRRPWQSGRHAARNLGFSQSSGEFVIFMDAGDSVTSDGIGALLSRIKAASNPGCTFGKPSNLNGLNRIKWVFASGKITDTDALIVADSLVLYRRASVDMAGAFKPALSVKEMDADFIQRVASSSSALFVDTPVGSRFQQERAASAGNTASETPAITP